MSVAYLAAQKQRYRITLELDVQGDFNPHNLDWEKVLDIQGNEKVVAYVEDLDTPDRWWFMDFWKEIEEIQAELLEDINDEMYQTDPEDWMGYDDSTEGIDFCNDFW